MTQGYSPYSINSWVKAPSKEVKSPSGYSYSQIPSPMAATTPKAAQPPAPAPGMPSQYLMTHGMSPPQYGISPGSRTYARAMPPKAPSAPVPAMSSMSQLAARGAQMAGATGSAPWSGSRAYDNIQLPDTELGPNQSEARVRDRVASRFDPYSWYNRTTTAGEKQTNTAGYTNEYLRQLRESGRDLTGAKSGYQYSPVASASAFRGITPTEQQRWSERMQNLTDFRNRQQEADRRLLANPQTGDRVRAMDGMGKDFVGPGDYRAMMSMANNDYNAYSRAMRLSGQKPVSFDNFLTQYSQPDFTPEIKAPMEAGKAMQREQAESRRAQRGGPNLAVSQFLNSRYGLPMQMPRDPARAQQWQDSLAMQGNPYAQAMNAQAQKMAGDLAQSQLREGGLDYRAGLQESGLDYRTGLEQSGLNYRADAQFGSTRLNPEERSQVMSQWASSDPTMAGDRAYRDHVSMAQQTGEWDADGGANRLRILQRAERLRDEAANRATSFRQMLANDPVFGQVVGGPQAAGPQSYGLPAAAPSALGTPTQVTAPEATQASTEVAAQYGINPMKNLPAVEPPRAATTDDLFAAYLTARQAKNGAEPTMDEVASILKEQNAIIPTVETGATRPYYTYSTQRAMGQAESPYNAQYKQWLEKNKQALGGNMETTWGYDSGFGSF